MYSGCTSTHRLHINKHKCSIKRAQVVAKWCHWLEYAYCLITNASLISAGESHYFALDVYEGVVWVVQAGVLNSPLHTLSHTHFWCRMAWLIYMCAFISINHFVIKSSFDSAIRQLNFIWFNEISGSGRSGRGGGDNGIDVECFFFSDIRSDVSMWPQFYAMPRAHIQHKFHLFPCHFSVPYFSLNECACCMHICVLCSCSRSDHWPAKNTDSTVHTFNVNENNFVDNVQNNIQNVNKSEIKCARKHMHITHV